MSITLTEHAARHVKRYLRQQQEGTRLRVRVKPTGCSGYMYVVEPAQVVQANDAIFQSRGVALVIDDQSLGMLDGTEIDYTREGLNEGFKFNNPNVKQTCGCGESFSI